MSKQKQKAFTLIELLVVIAIIGILATLAVVALQQARSRARDSKRMADMKQVQTALELFFNENGRYPTTEEWNSGSIVSSSTGETFMYSIPSAPTPADGDCLEASNSYAYIPSINGDTYTIDFCTGKQVSDLPEGAKQMTPGGIIFGSIAPSEPADSFAGTSGTFIDTRDSQEYAWVKIGDQIWMAENLNVGTRIDSTSDQTYNVIIEKYCYNNLESNCDIYGGLYQWNEMMQYIETEGSQGICPDGWHVPTDGEWYTLEYYLATGDCSSSRTDWGCDPAGSKLAGSYNLWSAGILRDHTDFNDSYFNALPAGYRNTNGSFSYLGSYSFLWSSSVDGSYAWYRSLYSSDSSVGRSNGHQTFGFSVRCLRTE